jgi:hypothetical protein
MKYKLLIIAGVGTVLVAAVFIYSIGHYLNSQRALDKGLWEACTKDNAAAAAYWLAKGANVNSRDEHGVRGIPGRAALHMCAHFANTRTVELLLLLGADANAVDNYGRTPLFFANFAPVADKLVAYGADIGKTDDNGETALQARRTNGWYVDDELRAVLEGKGPTATRRREFGLEHGRAESWTFPPTEGDFGKNWHPEPRGTARVWGIQFEVAEPVGGGAGSKFEGTVHSDPELTDARNTFNLGEDVNVRLEKVPGRPITFQMNGKRYGTLEVGDEVSIDKERNVTVNGETRQPASTMP